jgi:hypothetical protein
MPGGAVGAWGVVVGHSILYSVAKEKRGKKREKRKIKERIVRKIFLDME